MDVAGLVIDWHVFGTFAGAGVATLLARATGLAQRMRSLERRLDTQAELIADQQRQISGLTEENREQAKKLAEQDRVIRRQGQHIGDLTRQNREQAAQIDSLTAENVQQAEQNATLAADCARLGELHAAAEKRGKALLDELYEEKRKTGQTLPPKG